MGEENRNNYKDVAQKGIISDKNVLNMLINNTGGKSQLETGVNRYHLIRICIKINFPCNNPERKVETMNTDNFGGILD